MDCQRPARVQSLPFQRSGCNVWLSLVYWHSWHVSHSRQLHFHKSCVASTTCWLTGSTDLRANFIVNFGDFSRHGLYSWNLWILLAFLWKYIDLWFSCRTLILFGLPRCERPLWEHHHRRTKPVQPWVDLALTLSLMSLCSVLGQKRPQDEVLGWFGYKSWGVYLHSSCMQMRVCNGFILGLGFLTKPFNYNKLSSVLLQVQHRQSIAE